MMKAISALIVMAVCLSAALAGVMQPNQERDSLWQAYKTKFNKSYKKQFEEALRKAVWLANMEYVEKHNREYDLGQHSYTLGMNEYADMPHEEFKRVMLPKLFNITAKQGSTFLPPSNMADLPTTVDWRKKGYVTPVKNQGQCGSCWSFSATGSLEGQHFKKTGQLVSLSEQQLVDCSGSFGNNGCEGGLMDNAFKYIKSAGGIESEQEYPYTARNGRCHFIKSDVKATDTGFVDIPHRSEADLQKASASVGPISVAIDASHMSFQLYRSGVYDPFLCSEAALDHGVLVVGYGTYMTKDYWLVKNSWGSSWGQDGYIWMARNRDNKCGIASQASYPLV